MVTYTVKQLCWFGMRLWKAIHEHKEEKARERSGRQKGGR
jgi:hypothetical protein